MRNSFFDKHVKDELGGYRPAVPPHIWKNISAENDRDRPAIFWPYFNRFAAVAVLIFLLIGSGALYFLQHRGATPLNAENSSRAGVQITQSAHQPAIGSMGTTTPGNNAGEKSEPPVAVSTIASRDQMIIPAIAKNRINISQGKGEEIVLRSNINATLPAHRAFETRTAFPESKEGIVTPTGQIDLKATDINAAVLRRSIVINAGLRMPLLPGKLSIPCPKAEKDIAGNKKYVEIYAGPDHIIRSFNDANDPSYASLRKSTALSAFSYSAGIRYTRVFTSGVSFRTGINYSRINEKFQLTRGHITQNVYVTDNAGDTTGSYSISGTQYTQNTNRYTTFDVPLMVGYEAGNGRLHLNVNAGPLINILSHQAGLVADENGNALDIGNGKAGGIYRYRTNMGVSLGGAVSFYYKLNDALHLLAEPYFRYSLSPMTQEDLMLKQKYNTVGLRLGLRVDL